MNRTYDVKKTLGLALKELRESKDFSQEQLAEKLNLQSYQTINRIEKGKSFVTSALLEKMCDFFKVSPSLFFTVHKDNSSKERSNYSKTIKEILPSLSLKRLKDIHDIVLIFQK